MKSGLINSLVGIGITLDVQEQLDALDAAREAKGAAEDKKNNAKP
jgi:hypothetical protein